MPAFGPATLDDQTAILCGHPSTKAMGALPFYNAWLKRSFHRFTCWFCPKNAYTQQLAANSDSGSEKK